MTPWMVVKPGDRCSQWYTVDLSDVKGVAAPVVIPLFGSDHRAGMDCWCQPELREGVIVHAQSH